MKNITPNPSNRPNKPDKPDKPNASLDFEQALRTVLHRFDCPSGDDLAAYAWEELPADAAQTIAHHLTQCLSCTQELAAFVELRPVTPTLVDQAKASVQTMRQWVARLLPPNLTPQLSLRGERDLAQVPLVYEIDDLGWQVVLTWDAQHALTGQVLGPDEDALSQARARLVLDGEQVAETDVDASGWFDFGVLAAQDYRLHIDLPEDRLEMSLVSRPSAA